MAAYSIDRRQKILSAYERRLGSQRALAHLFGVSLSCVEKALRRYRSTCELGLKPDGGGEKLRLDAPAQVRVRQTERDTPRIRQARVDYRQLMATMDMRRLKCVDESGVNLAMTRLYGRAP